MQGGCSDESRDRQVTYIRMNYEVILMGLFELTPSQSRQKKRKNKDSEEISNG